MTEEQNLTKTCLNLYVLEEQLVAKLKAVREQRALKLTELAQLQQQEAGARPSVIPGGKEES